MIGHLIYAAALNAPEIGDAFVKYLARAVVGAVADEAKDRLTGGMAGFGSVLGSLGAEVFGSAVGKLEELSPEMQARVGAIMENALKEFDLVLIKADDLAELRRAAKAESPPTS